MKRPKSLWLFLSIAATATALMAVACGDDDDNNNNNPTVDGGNPDGSNNGDAGCTFAGYVIDLINTQTNATATPAGGDLGASCTPATSQDEFKSLFP